MVRKCEGKYFPELTKKGNKSGTLFVFQKEGRAIPLKRDAAYQSLAIIYLGLMAHRQTVDMDALHNVNLRLFGLGVPTGKAVIATAEVTEDLII